MEEETVVTIRFSRSALWAVLAIALLAVALFATNSFADAFALTPKERLSALLEAFQASGLFLTAIAVVAAFGQVRQAKKQLHSNRKWNQMNFALKYFADHPIEQWEQTLEKSIKLISRDEPLSEDELKDIDSDGNEDSRLALKNFMNRLESFSVAVNMNLAHEEASKRLFGHKFVRHFMELEPYILAQRQKTKDDGLFCEFVAVCKKWRGEFNEDGEKY